MSAGVPILMPDLGVTPVRLSVWYAEPGDRVYEGDRLVEVQVGGATFDVSAPTTGQLTEWRAYRNDALAPLQVLGIVTADG